MVWSDAGTEQYRFVFVLNNILDFVDILLSQSQCNNTKKINERRTGKFSKSYSARQSGSIKKLYFLRCALIHGTDCISPTLRETAR
jgi:hypothetical protein